MRSGFALLFSLAASCPLISQTLRFQHLTTDDGLTDNAITCVYEDHAGFIWIGTESGLNRYDGNAVLQVEGARDHITGIVEDKHGTFWISTKDHGLLRMEADAQTVTSLDHDAKDPRSIASDLLTCVFDLNDTTLLIGSREVSLIFMDKRTRAFTYWTDSASISPVKAIAQPMSRSGWCHAIIALDPERLWIGLLNFQTSLIVDWHSGKVVSRAIVQRAGSESQATALLEGHTLYNGGWQNGIDVMDLDQRPTNAMEWRPIPKVIDTPDETVALAGWTHGRILAGLRGAGVYMIDPSSGSVVKYKHQRSDPSSLASDRIRCLRTDRSGTLWVGTANGLDRCVPSVWAMQVRPFYDDRETDQPDLTFHRVQGGADGSIRAFTSEGFFIVDSALHTSRRIDVSSGSMRLQPTVQSVDHAGNMMLGTEYGILRYTRGTDPPTGALEPLDQAGHTYRVGGMYQVRAIIPDTVGTNPVFVIAALGYGIQVVDARTARVIGSEISPASTSAKGCFLVNSMVSDGKGTYWCASSGGLYAWHKDAKAGNAGSAGTSGSIIAPDEDVRQVVLHGDTLWALARSGMLLRMVDGKERRYQRKETMYGMSFDVEGRIWITTEDGLLRFDPADTSFIRIPINDGSNIRKLTRAITTLADGRMALCANNVLIVFDPNVYDALPALPLPYLTSILSAGTPVPISGHAVELSYRASVIDIGISARSLGLPRSLVFDYRLEGVENEWRSTSAKEAIRYAGVPVGSHALLIRVRDPFGRIGPEHRLLTIHVAGPIWQRWWFYAIALLLIAAAFYALYRYRLARAMELQAVRNRIASDLHDEVGSSLSSITIGSQLAAQLSSQENAQVKQIMSRIGETSSQSLRSMSDIVWAIDPKNDQGDALMKRMRRIAQELLEAKGIEVSFSVSGGVEELKLPMNARKEIVLIYKEAVHNASKYSGATLVQVSLHRRNGTLAVSVKDDGAGFDVALHPDGHGLHSMQRRASTLGCQLQMKSAPGLGTFVGIEVDITRIRD